MKNRSEIFFYTYFSTLGLRRFEFVKLWLKALKWCMNAARKRQIDLRSMVGRNMDDCSATIRLVLTDERACVCVAHDSFHVVWWLREIFDIDSDVSPLTHFYYLFFRSDSESKLDFVIWNQSYRSSIVRPAINFISFSYSHDSSCGSISP